MASHQVFDMAASVPTEELPTQTGKSVKLTRNNSNNSSFNLHSEDSSDEEMTRTHAKETRIPPVDVDLEALFAFDTETLVKLASTACGKQPESLWDSSRVPEDGAKEPKAESEMRKLIEQKDKQIEVLKKTVCDLLVWKAKYTDTQLPPQVTQMQVVRTKRGSAESITTRVPEENKSSDVALPLKRTPMRADAPEFVSLGIPLLVGSPKSTPESPKKPVGEQRSEREWRSFRAGRSPPRSVWKSSSAKNWRHVALDNNCDASIQKKLKSVS
uniref:Uncharacterized protein n=1 Tax=Noctiluca scintillans TaxID=2966 RepID=A0A7S1A4L9_NOCSC|mmetsp:Transcript_31443/g.83754  ORF Transcript_31443/g.83754 Transcript_31443/m.83754 type:complete len:271 (+) Transcript_31443:78-890(+)|eukprot:CAMPEP_0194487816 /NCGR_PEP_ID=MMETSP0253-20130528/7974_1 /TAXON_ID=2966 /ORGANISM="Noctiluca scintillans" /LENGTH=270 /DNA_ID=CAMNT_0039328093 /DNA_START=78 /DNA_END=890 /DNA_ORIENTATION=-